MPIIINEIGISRSHGFSFRVSFFPAVVNAWIRHDSRYCIKNHLHTSCSLIEVRVICVSAFERLILVLTKRKKRTNLKLQFHIFDGMHAAGHKKISTTKESRDFPFLFSAALPTKRKEWHEKKEFAYTKQIQLRNFLQRRQLKRLWEKLRERLRKTASQDDADDDADDNGRSWKFATKNSLLGRSIFLFLFCCVHIFFFIKIEMRAFWQSEREVLCVLRLLSYPCSTFALQAFV